MIAIRDFKMPENCLKCPMQFGGWCYVSPPDVDERVAPTVDDAWERGKPEWCPLIDVPDMNVGKCSEIPNSSDCINRQAAIDAIREAGIKEYDEACAIERVEKVQSVQNCLVYVCKEIERKVKGALWT